MYRFWKIVGKCNFSEEKSKGKDKGVPQSQTAALPWYQEEEETDNSKQAQIEQTYEKHQGQLPPPKATPKRPKNTRTERHKARHKTNRPAEQIQKTYKPL